MYKDATARDISNVRARGYADVVAVFPSRWNLGLASYHMYAGQSYVSDLGSPGRYTR